MEQEMHEHLSNLIIGAGSVFVMAGVIQVSCQAFEARPAKRGRPAGIRLKKWSFQSMSPGVLMIAVGALLLGGGP
jgi:hypothetical protein